MEECEECGYGKYQQNQGASECNLCSPGTYGDYLGNVSDTCQMCMPGKYNQTPGAKECEDCQVSEADKVGDKT